MATAYAARRLGIPATIVVPSTTPALTIERLKDEGATVEVVGEVGADAVLGGRAEGWGLITGWSHSSSQSLPTPTPADAG